MKASLCFSLVTFYAVATYGQTIVEHAATTAGASTAAAGMSGTGKSIGGVFRNLSETVDKAAAGKDTGSARATSAPAAADTAATAASAVPAKRSPPAIHASRPIDPSQVAEGLDGGELFQRFGPPVWRVSEKRNAQMVERLWYKTDSSNAGTPDEVEIKLIDGKVAAVIPPAPKKQAESRN